MANEKRLIDANAYAYPGDLINEPTIDAVEVVRCKDCAEWDKNEQECKHWYGFRAKDFCSYGERREEE